MKEEFLPKLRLVPITLLRVPVPSVPVMQKYFSVRRARPFSLPPVCLLSVFPVEFLPSIRQKSVSTAVEIKDKTSTSQSERQLWHRWSLPHDAKGLLNWHNPRTWPGGAVPTRGSDVVIPPGKSVVLRLPLRILLGKVMVPATSTLVIGRSGSVGDEPILLNSTGIDVAGTLIAGSTTCPIDWPRVEITLHSKRGETTRVNAARPHWMKGIHVSGTLDLHGAPLTRSWTRLAATTGPGAKRVTLKTRSTGRRAARCLSRAPRSRIRATGTGTM
jgi:hypothetical protein